MMGLGDEYLAALLQWGVVTATCLALGSALLSCVYSGNRPFLSLLKQQLRLAACCALLGLVLQTAYTAAEMYDEGLEGAFEPNMYHFIWQSSLGTALALRAAGLLLCLLSSFGRPGLVLPLFGALLSASSFAASGHAVAEPRLLLAVLITVHLLCISFWFAAVPALMRGAFSALRLPQLRDVAETFGGVAALATALVVASGALFILLRFEDIWGLLSSGYGLTLLAKLTLVVVIFALAALHKWRLVPGLQNDGGRMTRRLGQSLALELLLFLAIFVCVAAMTRLFTLPHG